MKLANRFHIVMTGHSDLTEAEKETVRVALEEKILPKYIDQYTKEGILGICGAACGADTMLGIACHNSNIAFQRYIPAGYRHVFLEPVWYGFRGEDKMKALAEFDYLERVAEATCLTDPQNSKYMKGTNFKRNEQMASVCDQLIIASRWHPLNERPARGSGTGHMVNHCFNRKIALPMWIWINPTNGEVRKLYPFGKEV